MAEGTSSEEPETQVQVNNAGPVPTSASQAPEITLGLNNNKEASPGVIITLPILAHATNFVCTMAHSGIPEPRSVKVDVCNPEDNSVTVDSHSNTRRHSKSSSLPHGVKLCSETQDAECIDVAGNSLAEEKWVKLEEELRKAHQDLQAKDDEVEKLKGIRQLVEDELHDLTSSLFVEAHKMVSDAKMKEIASEKHLKETKMQMEGLQAEVAALKALLITSTPSKPNLGGGISGISTIFKKQHKRTPSHHHLVYGRADETEGGKGNDSDNIGGIDRDHCEIDPILHHLFETWRGDPTLNPNRSEFLKKIYEEDINPCIRFQNEELVKRLIVAIEDNSIWVDPLPEKSKTNVQTLCALLQIPRICHYQMRFAFNSDEAFDISQLCRDRVAAVCEFLNYLRYIKNGLVKASVDDSYWEIIRLRKQMSLAKLGLPISS